VEPDDLITAKLDDVDALSLNDEKKLFPAVDAEGLDQRGYSPPDRLSAMRWFSPPRHVDARGVQLEHGVLGEGGGGRLGVASNAGGVGISNHLLDFLRAWHS